VPRRSTHPRRKTIGVRVPGHPVAHALLAELNEPSTVIDLTGDVASVLRRGKGSLEPFAVEPV